MIYKKSYKEKRGDLVGFECSCHSCQYANAQTASMCYDEEIEWHKTEILRMKILESAGALREQGFDGGSIRTLETRLEALTIIGESGFIYSPEQ